MTRLPAKSEQALLQRLLGQDTPASVPHKAPGSHAKARKPPKLTDGARRHCIECGAIVGKGRKALTCAVCDLVAALPDDVPPPVRELVFAPPRKWRFDLSWPARRVACEADGGSWAPGGGRHATDADRDKLNHAASMGWRLLRFSPQQIERDPAGCVALIRRALEA